MKPRNVVMRRSAAKMWLLGVAGVPLLIMAVEYVWGSFGFLNQLGKWAYRGGDVEPFEIKDDILVALLALLGASLVVVSIKELLFPRKVVEASESGMRFALKGPFKASSPASWLQIKDLIAGDKALIVQLDHRGALPDDPWGARWIDQNTLRISGTLWERGADQFINEIAGLGLPTAARRQQLAPDLLAKLDAWVGDSGVPPPPRPLPEAHELELEPTPEPQEQPELKLSPAPQGKVGLESESESAAERHSEVEPEGSGSDEGRPV
jgi:hypothetical protein